MYAQNKNRRRIAAVALVLIGIVLVAASVRSNPPTSRLMAGGKSAMIQMGSPSGAQPGSGGAASGAQNPSGIHTPTDFVVRGAKYHDTSIALRAMNPRPETKARTYTDVENSLLPSNPMFSGFDPVVQTTFGVQAMPGPLNSWTGYTQQDNYDLYNGLGVLPPDTNGDVGPNHYVEYVNNGFKIFDKQGNLLFGPAKGSTLWAGMPVCGTQDHGDPITLYDQLSGRWLMSQFGFIDSHLGPYYECIAVSATGDPLGAWHRYEFELHLTNFEDYPHLGVWPDGYYMTTNEFTAGTTFAGAGNFVFERDKMLNGEQARFVYFHLDSPHGGFLPSDLDGNTPPPPGTPNFFIELWDDVVGQLAMYKFHVDWSNPALSTFTGPTFISIAPFDYDLCAATREACVDQPGTTQKLELIGDRLMYRMAYRNFGTHESIVVNHSVDAGGKAGVRWYELRNPSGVPVTYQQGTFAPDSNHRWMGSAAMDRDGNIAIGYTASGTSLFPSIRYAGRLATDPLGVLAQGENTLIAGGGNQTHSSGRWGDYSFLSVDPVDDCTFWYASEFNPASSSASWGTGIGSFRFPNCGNPPPTGTPPTATPTNTPTNTPIPTATPACSNVYNSTAGSQLIPDAAGLTSLTSTITIANGPTIAGLEVVNLGIEHTWPEDLDVYLISPSGVRIELFTDVCAGNPDWTQANTGFTLSGSAATAIGTTCAPGQGAYRPEGSLAALIGQSSNGTWTLQVTDDTIQDTGFLHSWGLKVLHNGCVTPTNTPLPPTGTPIPPTNTATPTNTPTATFTPTATPTACPFDSCAFTVSNVSLQRDCNLNYGTWTATVRNTSTCGMVATWTAELQELQNNSRYRTVATHSDRAYFSGSGENSLAGRFNNIPTGKTVRVVFSIENTSGRCKPSATSAPATCP
jgi:subtilisin-like proprotein convertase family protein